MNCLLKVYENSHVNKPQIRVSVTSVETSSVMNGASESAPRYVSVLLLKCHMHP